MQCNAVDVDMEVVLEMQTHITNLEAEIAKLKHDVESKSKMIQQLSDCLLLQTPVGELMAMTATRKVSEKYLIYKAKWLFYKENKSQMNPIIYSWRQIKRETDELFNSLNKEEKERYITNAIKSLK